MTSFFSRGPSIGKDHYDSRYDYYYVRNDNTYTVYIYSNDKLYDEFEVYSIIDYISSLIFMYSFSTEHSDRVDFLKAQKKKIIRDTKIDELCS